MAATKAVLTARTGTYDRFVSRYVALDWAVGRDRPGQIRMDGFGGLCLDAGNGESAGGVALTDAEPRRGAQVQVWECAGGGAVAGADARARAAQQTWVFAENQLRLAGTQLCVEVVEDDAAAAAEGNLRLEGCKGSRFAQWWRLKDASRSFTVQGPLWV